MIIDLSKNKILMKLDFSDDEIRLFLDQRGYKIHNVSGTQLAFKEDEKVEWCSYKGYVYVFERLVHDRYKEILKENILDNSYIRNDKIDNILK